MCEFLSTYYREVLIEVPFLEMCYLHSRCLSAQQMCYLHSRCVIWCCAAGFGSTTVLKIDLLDQMLVCFLQEHNDTYWGTCCTCCLVITYLTTCTRGELYYCCLLSTTYTLALSRNMLSNYNLFNYMLFWFYPLALICFSQCMLHVLASNFVLGLSRCL